MSETKEGRSMSRVSSFSATCNRLSQYIKQNGGARTISNLKQPLDLFPEQVGLTSSEHKVIKSDQLTIFYSGKVLVFDNFPADKAENLMRMAASCGGAAADPSLAPAAAAGYLPPAGRRSLHRFLGKRKVRMDSKAPYASPEIEEEEEKGSTPKKEESSQMAWLRLAQKDVLMPAMSSESSGC